MQGIEFLTRLRTHVDSGRMPVSVYNQIHEYEVNIMAQTKSVFTTPVVPHSTVLNEEEKHNWKNAFFKFSNGIGAALAIFMVVIGIVLMLSEITDGSEEFTGLGMLIFGILAVVSGIYFTQIMNSSVEERNRAQFLIDESTVITFGVSSLLCCIFMIDQFEIEGMFLWLPMLISFVVTSYMARKLDAIVSMMISPVLLVYVFIASLMVNSTDEMAFASFVITGVVIVELIYGWINDSAQRSVLNQRVLMAAITAGFGWNTIFTFVDLWSTGDNFDSVLLNICFVTIVIWLISSELLHAKYGSKSVSRFYDNSLPGLTASLILFAWLPITYSYTLFDDGHIFAVAFYLVLAIIFAKGNPFIRKEKHGVSRYLTSLLLVIVSVVNFFIFTFDVFEELAFIILIPVGIVGLILAVAKLGRNTEAHA